MDTLAITRTHRRLCSTFHKCLVAADTPCDPLRGLAKIISQWGIPNCRAPTDRASIDATTGLADRQTAVSFIESHCKKRDR